MAPDGEARALVLFDIDGTLIRRAGPHHREALVRAVRDVAGVHAPLDHIPLHGMLDRDILRWMMRDAGVPARRIQTLMPAIVERAQAIYVRNCPDLSGKTCPGVRPLLERLARHAALVLVTGNLSRIGWKKMERAGLGSYFRFGAFAEMAPDRAGLARLAIRHARRSRWIGPSAPVSLIGDAPQDIEAARRNGIRAIAVHTGISTPGELAALQPDVLLPSLRDLRLRMVLSPD